MQRARVQSRARRGKRGSADAVSGRRKKPNDAAAQTLAARHHPMRQWRITPSASGRSRALPGLAAKPCHVRSQPTDTPIERNQQLFPTIGKECGCADHRGEVRRVNRQTMATVFRTANQRGNRQPCHRDTAGSPSGPLHPISPHPISLHPISLNQGSSQPSPRSRSRRGFQFANGRHAAHARCEDPSLHP